MSEPAASGHEAVTRDEAARRYELSIDGQVVGFATFLSERIGDTEVTILPHTEIEPAYGGRGLGSTMVRGMLDDLRSRGERVVPACPFVKYWIDKHPDYADMVVSR